MVNRCILIGHLTKDVEVSTTNNGIAVAKFTIAVQRRFKNADGEYDTDFINCVAWRELAEHCGNYLAKGKKCAVVGSLQTRSYEAQDGTKRYVSEVVAEEVEFLTPKTTTDELEPVDVKDEELPF